MVNKGRNVLVHVNTTHCQNGHLLSEVGVYLKKDGYRQCRACALKWGRERNKRLAEERKARAVQPPKDIQDCWPEDDR